MRTLRQELVENYRGLIPDTTLELEQRRQAREVLKKMDRPVADREPISVRQSIEQAWYGPSLDEVVQRRHQQQRGF